MKYYRVTEEGREPLSYEEALHILLGTYRDNDMTRDMLTIGNCIQCRFSTVRVLTDDGMTAMAGLFNLLPDDVEYDDKGNRIRKGA